jgi:hypothetical protein
MAGLLMPSVTFTVAGPFSFTAPANGTSFQVEGWGGGQGGGNYQFLGGVSGAGGNAGEYAAEPSLTLLPGVTYYGQVGAPGAPGGAPGGNTTFNGSQVTAHGGTSAGPGTGSSNSIHHNGGQGGAGVTGSGGHHPGGGSGGSSGAPSGAGNNGSAGSTSGASAAGAAALASGGKGGNGGPSGNAGSAGGSPGGGGGGGGYLSPGASGGTGQVRITWTNVPGSPSSFPLPLVPFFPAGRIPSQSDLNGWLHDPFAFLENRIVFRARQTASAQALPSSAVATVLQYDTIDEDPMGGWQAGAWAWGPASGFSGLYEVTVTLYTVAGVAGNAIRPGIIAPGSPAALGMGYPGTAVGGVQGTFWCYLVGGQDTVQATGSLLNAAANLNTDIAAGQQSSMEVTWLSS